MRAPSISKTKHFISFLLLSTHGRVQALLEVDAVCRSEDVVERNVDVADEVKGQIVTAKWVKKKTKMWIGLVKGVPVLGRRERCV